MNISFALTLLELHAGIKTRTSRIWTPRTFRMWVKAWEEKRLEHVVWTKSARFGGQRDGKIKMTRCPYRERLGDMTPADLLAEGGRWKTVADFAELFDGNLDQEIAVVWFKYLGN